MSIGELNGTHTECPVETGSAVKTGTSGKLLGDIKGENSTRVNSVDIFTKERSVFKVRSLSLSFRQSQQVLERY